MRALNDILTNAGFNVTLKWVMMQPKSLLLALSQMKRHQESLTLLPMDFFPDKGDAIKIYKSARL